MYFDFLLLNAFIKQRDAAPQLDGVHLKNKPTKATNEVMLCKNMGSECFKYSLLIESQRLRSKFNGIEELKKKQAQSNVMDNNCSADDRLPDGVEFTASNRIDKIEMNDSFDLHLLKEILELRNAFGRVIDKKYFKNNDALLFQLLLFYYELDYSTFVQAKVYDHTRKHETYNSVDKNTIFATNLVYNLARAKRLRHYRRLLWANDNYGINLPDEDHQDSEDEDYQVSEDKNSKKSENKGNQVPEDKEYQVPENKKFQGSENKGYQVAEDEDPLVPDDKYSKYSENKGNQVPEDKDYQVSKDIDSQDSEDDESFVESTSKGLLSKRKHLSILDKDFVSLFNSMPVVKAAILLCSFKNNKVVFKQNKFQIEHFTTKKKDESYLLVREKSNKTNVGLTDLLGFAAKPTFIQIRLPAENVIEYFKFIRSILCLFDSIQKIQIFFFDSETAKKYNFSKNIDNKAQHCLSLIVNDLVGKELVSYRPKIHSFVIIGYKTIDDAILNALAKIPLNNFFLLGTDSKLDCLYTLKLFEPQCELKTSIREFAGTVGAAGILYSQIGGEQLKGLHVFTHMQYKNINDDMIRSDPLYNRLLTYFERGNLQSLPKVCRQGPNGEEPEMKFVVDKMRFYSPYDTWFSPAGYNSCPETKNQVIKEEIVTIDDLEEMVLYRIKLDANSPDFENKTIATINIKTPKQSDISAVLLAVKIVEGANNLVIKCTWPLDFNETFIHDDGSEKLIQLFISVFECWIVENKNKNHMLTFEAVENERTKGRLRGIFIYLYNDCHRHGIDKKLLARVTFKKLIQ
ncbi:hypothetical protein ENBRE01_2560 [Enteropsectra breve]|nr:hypothetical protein ENBRE01_2560 [Enteropsectra breve]